MGRISGMTHPDFEERRLGELASLAQRVAQHGRDIRALGVESVQREIRLARLERERAVLWVALGVVAVVALASYCLG